MTDLATVFNTVAFEQVISDPRDLDKVYDALKGREFIGIDFETRGLDVIQDTVHGIAIGNREQQEFYITEEALQPAWNLLVRIDHEHSPTWVGHNLGFDLHFMWREGFFPTNILDTMIMQWLLDSSEKLSLKYLSETKLGYFGLPEYKDLRNEVFVEIKKIAGKIKTDQGYLESLAKKLKKEGDEEGLKDTEDRINKIKENPYYWTLEIKKATQVTIDMIWDLEREKLVEYACRDIELTLKLMDLLMPKLEAEGNEDLLRLLWEKEMPFTKLLVQMEAAGMAIDLEYVKELREKYVTIHEQLSETWLRLTGPVMAKYFMRSADSFKESFTRLVKTYHPEMLSEDHEMYSVWKRRRMESVETLMDEIELVLSSIKNISEEKEAPYSTPHAEKVVKMFESHVNRFEDMLKDFDPDNEDVEECKRLMQRFSIAYLGVNYNSPVQLAVLFFEAMGFEPPSYSDAGNPSTDSLSIIRLRRQFKKKDNPDILETLVDIRLYSKILSTYIDGAFLSQNVNGRIHCSLNQTGTETTRISASGPNLQNIPSKRDIGKEIRMAFIAGPGMVLVVVDFSQIEMRLIAHYCGDENMLTVFREGRDPHEETRVRIGFEERVEAKTINFGMPYGMGPLGYANALEKAGRPRPKRKEAERAIAMYDQVYPGWPAWKKKVWAWARHLGYVATIDGHRRYLPDLNSPVMELRGAAERQAPNAIIQGSAADIIKEAMLNISAGMDWYPGARLLMQVHDELIFEVPEEMAEQFADFVQYEMERTRDIFGLNVDILAEPSIGKNWAEAK